MGMRRDAYGWPIRSQACHRRTARITKQMKGWRLHLNASILAVSEAEVRANFERYGLLDDQVRFLPGWFKDTLHDAPIGRIAVLRLDGDL